MAKARKRESKPDTPSTIVRRTETTGIYKRTTVKAAAAGMKAIEADMKVVFSELKENVRQKGGLDDRLADMERQATQTLKAHGIDDPAKGVPPDAEPIVRDLADVLLRVGTVRRCLRKRKTRDAVAEAIRLGAAYERVGVRQFEPVVKIGRDVAFRWCGRWVKVTPLEQEILNFMADKSSATMPKFVKEVWGKAYDPDNSGPYHKALSLLNRKIRHTGVVLSIRADHVTRCKAD